MFELRGKAVSARQKLSRLIRIFGSPESKTSNVSSPIGVPYRQVNSHVDSALLAESRIAQALMYSQMRDRPR